MLLVPWIIFFSFLSIAKRRSNLHGRLRAVFWWEYGLGRLCYWATFPFRRLAYVPESFFRTPKKKKKRAKEKKKANNDSSCDRANQWPTSTRRTCELIQFRLRLPRIHKQPIDFFLDSVSFGSTFGQANSCRALIGHEWANQPIRAGTY